jgi:carbon monoxide dehydrogenase subunit G
VDLTHSFTVPAGVDQTWRTFLDIEDVANCFPGATVTSVEGEDFTGTCKVKLGPIALVYSGSGTFLERDESAHRFVVEAKGKDKRGNGTAGATVVAVMTPGSGGSTDVEVTTNLSVTGKPAQFGRGVIQDVSDKLLQQFVTCLESKVGAPEAAGPTAEGTTAPDVAPVEVPPQGTERTGPESALDLGATVLPVLVKAYWKQLAGGLLAALVLKKLLGRRR